MSNKITLAGFRRDADRDFLNHVDPFVFAKAAFLATQADSFCAEDIEILAENFGASGTNLQHDLVHTGNVLTHQYRFFQAETAIMLMLAGIPDEPLLATLKRLKGNTWDNALRSIARGEVPDLFSMAENGQTLAFEDWIIAALMRQSRNSSEGHRQLVEYISSEAQFLEKKGRFNAFKHGCRAKGSSFRIEIEAAEGSHEYATLMEAEHAIFWAEWPNLTDLSYTLSAKVFDPKRDLARINFGAQLVRLWKELRQKDFCAGQYKLLAFDATPEPTEEYKLTNRFSLSNPRPSSARR